MLDQGAYGADAKKATTLMLVNLPELAEKGNGAPHRGQFRRLDDLTTALGRISGTTEFRTARLKEYPPELRKLFADAVVSHCPGALSQLALAPLPAEWQASCCAEMSGHMSADCANEHVRLNSGSATGRSGRRIAPAEGQPPQAGPDQEA